MSDSRTDLTTFSRLFCVTNTSPNLLKLLQNSNELSLLFQTRTTTRRTPRSEDGEGQARRNRNMCRSTALAHNLSTHSVWLLILFLYALPRRQSPCPSLRGATVLKCVTIVHMFCRFVIHQRIHLSVSSLIREDIRPNGI